MSDQNTADHDLLIKIDTKLDAIASRDEDKERRLRSLERSRWMLAGVVAVLSPAAGIITELAVRR